MNSTMGSTHERLAQLASCAELFARYTGPFSLSDLESLLECELGSLTALEQPTGHGPLLSQARAPDHILHVVSGNTPHAAFQSILRGLLLGAPNHVKLPSTGLPEFETAITKLPASLRELVTTTRELPADWRDHPGAVIVFGNDATIAWFAKHTPAHKRLLTHGQRLSFGLVSGDPAGAAHHAARDVCLFDQLGCLSVHDLYIHPDAGIPLSQFGRLLATEMANFSSRHPRAPLTPSEEGAITNLRETTRFLAASQPDQFALWESASGTRWTVIHETSPILRVSPLNRVVFVKPWPVEDPAAALGPECRHLASIALHPFDRHFAQSLVPLGPSRICPMGRTQVPTIFWHHDEIPPLASLVAWTDLG